MKQPEADTTPELELVQRASAAALEQWERVYALTTMLETSLRCVDEHGGTCPTERRVAEVVMQEVEVLRDKMVTALTAQRAGVALQNAFQAAR